MKLSQFKFKLTEDRIAQYPMRQSHNEDGTRAFFDREECRLMVVHTRSRRIEHRRFTDLLDYFEPGDTFVFNDTRVFPARLFGNKEKTGARIEVFLLRELNEELRLWDVLVDPARKIRIGNKLYFGPDESMVAEVIDNTTSRGRTLRFLFDGSHDEFKQALYRLGEAPLPRDIITRPAEPEDIDDFQTVFARREGAVTAPTTGLHFSRAMLTTMEIKGINIAYVTLHCGLGCFRHIDVEDLTKHKMDSEEMHVDSEACRIVNEARDNGHRVIAVGTTVQRVLETAVSADNHLKEFDGWTNKFIFPPHEFTLADAMVANFYLPESTLLMLTAAFGDYDFTFKEAYRDAVRNRYPVLDAKGEPVLGPDGEPLTEQYRFGTYGDAMLILKD